jgi:SAM-dependent methyltransferase
MMLERYLPSDTNNFAARSNYLKFRKLLLERNASPVVLVIGAGEGGVGTEMLSDLRLINSDISRKSTTNIVADAHHLPFSNATLDGVVAQAVLEHVLDPFECVKEIHRVLKPGGLVYSEIPFMQQVHGAQFDFLRFTHLGHRRLFRYFSEIESGIACGPGSSLAWAWEYFWLSFTSHRGMIRKSVRAACRISTFWAPLLDPWISRRKGAYDGASGFYFLGSKADHPLSDKELLTQFRGVS